MKEASEVQILIATLARDNARMASLSPSERRAKLLDALASVDALREPTEKDLATMPRKIRSLHRRGLVCFDKAGRMVLTAKGVQQAEDASLGEADRERDARRGVDLAEKLKEYRRKKSGGRNSR